MLLYITAVAFIFSLISYEVCTYNLPAPIAEMTSSSSLLVAMVMAWGSLSGMSRMSLIGEFKCINPITNVCNQS